MLEEEEEAKKTSVKTSEMKAKTIKANRVRTYIHINITSVGVELKDDISGKIKNKFQIFSKNRWLKHLRK